MLELLQAANDRFDFLPANENAAPLPGDRDIGTAYAALGEALGAWQHFELAWAHLYARFRGYAGWLDKIRHFGACNPTFAMRLSAIETAAEHFFSAAPDKDREVEFLQICVEAEQLAARRDRIAHGVVANVAGDAEPARFVLQLPWYTHDRQRIEADSAMGSHEIAGLSARFAALAERARILERRCASARG